MTTWLRALVPALVLTAVPVGAGVLLAGGDDAGPAPIAHESTPLSAYDTSGVRVLRGGFCERIAPEAVTDALGDEAVDDEAWTDGEEAPGVGQVTQEFGCRYASDAGDEATAWVLAAPVTAERAARIVGSAREEPGCAAVADAPAYGDPSVAVRCTGPRRTFLSFRGLFGDAWLTCRLAVRADTTPETQLDRTGRWCVAIARAASAG